MTSDVALGDIVAYLDDLLDNDDWTDADAATNGLQVDNSGGVDRVAFAVDAATQTVDEAARRDADALVVHHGIFWGGADSIRGQRYERVRRLVENDMALYASHLPLDAHDEVGNNALLLDALGAEPRGSFGRLGPEDVGRVGRLGEPAALGAFVDTVEGAVDREPTVLDFGPDTVETVAVLTGAGGGLVAEAAETGADVFVTGEPKHRAHHDAREHGLNAVFAGHYHTETFGVRALNERVDSRFDVDVTYISEPTRV